MTRCVVVTDHVFDDLEIERAVLARAGAELVVAPATDERTLSGLAGRADALLVCYAPITASVVAAAADGGVRIISRYGIGVDNVDVVAASEHGIVVTNVPDYCLDEVADHAIALLLACARGALPAAAAVRDGGWSFPRQGIHRLRGRQLTLVGIGRIGTRVAERAVPLGLRVVAHDPAVSGPPLETVALSPSLNDALAEADFVSLHAPLTAETDGLVDEAAIAAMHRAPVLINTSRGGLVDLAAVTAALADGRLSGVALDVSDPEPLPADHPLRRHPRAIVTPHMAFYSAEAQAELQRRAAEEVARALLGEPPRSPVEAPARAGRAG